MDLLKTYEEVNKILDTLDFNALFEGFKKYRFALYTSKEIALDGKIIPYREGFRGCTSIEFEGEHIAIWDLERCPTEGIDYLAYGLAHEMFHCHQYSQNVTEFPSDFELMTYPDDLDNYNKKYNENRYLADALEHKDIEALKKFLYLRNERFKKYPDKVKQEFLIENLEGMAEYVGLKALERVCRNKFEGYVSDYLKILRDEVSLLFNIRRIAYYSGAIYFLCLEKLGIRPKYDLASDKTAYEQYCIDTTGVAPEVISFDSIKENYEKVISEKDTTIKDFLAKADYTEFKSAITGYDPMNMFRLGDIVFCTHFVCLTAGNETKTFDGNIALKLKADSLRDVEGYYR